MGRSAILSYAWMRNEPPLHHTCMSAAMGLDKGGGNHRALFWRHTIRAGEALKSFRRDLLLPDDAFCSNSFCLLAIDEAKTRFSAARHQCAKIDAPDLMVVIFDCFQETSSERTFYGHGLVRPSEIVSKHY